MYFSLFNTIFGFATTTMPNVKSIIKFTCKRWLVIIFLITLLGIIVRFNTLVHPYLLADNRHYTFYLWNRFYGKFELARYAIIPIYCFSLLNIRENLKSKSFGFQLLFILCGIVQMALQKMIEVRYFLLPYLILRLNCKVTGLRWILMELLFYVVVNAATFYVFFTKEIWWDDYKDVQRLIW
jgi:alpha-1,2-glucosyltransferase